MWARKADVVRHLYFLGVSTSHSSIMTIFPAWAEALGLDAQIVGLDLALTAPPDEFRTVLARMADDPFAAGALVTTHKTALYDAAHDLFTDLDDWARLCREVSCIALRPQSIRGWAKDPITARQACTWLLGDDPWAGGDTDVVCLGAGGAGLALTVAVLGGVHQPTRYVLVDKDPRRLDIARSAVAQLDVRAEVEYVVTAAASTSDSLVASARPGSLVVNATGMGKDLPGSPVSDRVVFPVEAIAWDLNYRGDLRFLDFASAQSADRGVRISDGWQYFLHGWTEVIGEVFDVAIDSAAFDGLKAIAELITGRAPVEAGGHAARGVSRA